MGAGGGGTPTLQLHAHAGTVSPTGTRYTRRVTPRHKHAHAGTPASHCATAPRGRGPAHRHCAHAAPGPSSRCRHGGTCTPEHDAAVGTCGDTHGGSSPVCRAGSAAGGCSAAGLWEVSHCSGDQPGSHHTRTMHTHAHVHSCAHTYNYSAAYTSTHVSTHTHMHTLSLYRTPCLSPPAPLRGSRTARSCAARGERSRL